MAKRRVNRRNTELLKAVQSCHEEAKSPSSATDAISSLPVISPSGSLRNYERLRATCVLRLIKDYVIYL